MKSKILLCIIAVLSLYACKRKCEGGCGANYVCSNGQCQCKQWYEGANCDTPMSQKFAGSFIGTLYTNGANPKADTVSLFNNLYGELSPNYVYFSIDTALVYGTTTDSILGLNPVWIELTSSTQGNCYLNYTTPNISPNINCGDCQITKDGKTLTFSYYPLVQNSSIPDSTKQYTFVGVKQ